MPLHLRWPLALQPNGSLAAVEQGTSDEILLAAKAVLATTRGSRVGLPGFGVRDTAFSAQQLSAAEVSAAVSQWDDRITAVEVALDQDGDLAIVNVTLSSEGA